MNHLVLGGGGIKGIVYGCWLQQFEALTGKPCCLQFDLLTGTSTGGIYALGLGLGIPAAALQTFYASRGPVIFNRRWFHWGLLRAKYDVKTLHGEAKEIFGSKRLGDSLTKVLVCSTHAEDFTSRQFRSWVPEEQDFLVADVATATAAAPTYFAPWPIELGNVKISCIDGGMWANDPCEVARLEGEAIGWSNDECVMIDLACAPSEGARQTNTGLIGVGREIVEAFMDSGMDWARWACHMRLGDRFLQITAKPGASSQRLDDCSRLNIDALFAAGTDQMSDAVAHMRATLSKKEHL